MAMMAMQQRLHSCSWAPGLHCCSMAKQNLQGLNSPKCCCRVHSIPVLCAPLLEHVSTNVQKELHTLRTPACTVFAIMTVYGSVIKDNAPSELFLAVTKLLERCCRARPDSRGDCLLVVVTQTCKPSLAATVLDNWADQQCC